MKDIDQESYEILQQLLVHDKAIIQGQILSFFERQASRYELLRSWRSRKRVIVFGLMMRMTALAKMSTGTGGHGEP